MLISISFINIRILFYFLFCGVLKKKKKKIQYTRKDIRHDRDEIIAPMIITILKSIPCYSTVILTNYIYFTTSTSIS